MVTGLRGFWAYLLPDVLGQTVHLSPGPQAAWGSGHSLFCFTCESHIFLFLCH